MRTDLPGHDEMDGSLFPLGLGGRIMDGSGYRFLGLLTLHGIEVWFRTTVVLGCLCARAPGCLVMPVFCMAQAHIMSLYIRQP